MFSSIIGGSSLSGSYHSASSSERSSVILGVGSSDFCGSGKNKTRILHELGKRGHETHYVCASRPHLLSQVHDVAFETHIVSTLVSDFLRDPGLLLTTSLSECLTELALESIANSLKPILWATYLFPFAQAALLAKQAIRSATHTEVPLIVTPAGSDIWQIGPRVPSCVRILLNSPDVTMRIAYTAQFADEIRQRYDLDMAFEIIPPTINISVFRPYSDHEKASFRARLGIAERATVIVNHSNMRPVKRPDLVLRVTEEAVALCSRSVDLVLLLVGPRPSVQHGTLAELIPGVPTKLASGLVVIWTDIVADVVPHIGCADIALNCSVHDSFNISLLEAMACGLPVVTTDVVGIAPKISTCAGGIVVPTASSYIRELQSWDVKSSSHGDKTDVKVLACAIAQLINAPALRREQGARAAKMAREEFNHGQSMRRYEELFDRLVAYV